MLAGYVLSQTSLMHFQRETVFDTECLGTLKQSLFGLLIPEPNVKQLFASDTLIFAKNYHTGLNTLRTPAELGESKLDKN